MKVYFSNQVVLPDGEPWDESKAYSPWFDRWGVRLYWIRGRVVLWRHRREMKMRTLLRLR